MTTKTTDGMTPLTQDETQVFERRLEMARKQIADIDQQIERVLEAARERIAALKEKRGASLKMYDAACTMLGIENDLGAEPEADQKAS